MNKKTIREIGEIYDLELDRIVIEIKLKKAKRVLLQFPDGMKQCATTIVDELESRLKNVEFIIWFGSCYGACDTPNIPKNLKVDLVIQFGHSAWKN